MKIFIFITVFFTQIQLWAAEEAPTKLTNGTFSVRIASSTSDEIYGIGGKNKLLLGFAFSGDLWSSGGFEVDANLDNFHLKEDDGKKSQARTIGGVGLYQNIQSIRLSANIGKVEFQTSNSAPCGIYCNENDLTETESKSVTSFAFGIRYNDIFRMQNENYKMTIAPEFKIIKAWANKFPEIYHIGLLFNFSE